MHQCATQYLGVEYWGDSFTNDMTNLMCAKNVVVGFGTVADMIYYASSNLATMYIPDYYTFHSRPIGDITPCANLVVVQIPNYIKPGEWENTTEQRRFMLEYTFPEEAADETTSE